MKTATLSRDLEYSLLNAISRGVIPADLVQPDELGKEGQTVLAALSKLRETTTPPYVERAVTSVATDVLGAERDKIRPYIVRVFQQDSGREAADILWAVRSRQALTDVMNEVGQQLARGSLDVGAITERLRVEQRASLVPAITLIGKELPKRPVGIQLPKLPRINEATNGLLGMWVLGGETGVGKSTFALQLSAMIGETMPVLYYDAENGTDILLANLGEGLGSIERLREATKQMYFLPTIRTLDADLNAVKPPALVVVDSIQKFGFSTASKSRRDSIDSLLGRLEKLKKRGYSVIVLSEVSRGNYGEVRNSGYAETRELEYSADMAAQLVGDGTEDGDVDFHITKNRHSKKRGLITSMERVNNWWFREIDSEVEQWTE
ncbi:MAG: AAA family ATPase [Thaumarchaeota archaeon]|nr:AAA family ATPase [Nitrososphaerota archaeon]